MIVLYAARVCTVCQFFPTAKKKPAELSAGIQITLEKEGEVIIYYSQLNVQRVPE